MAASRVQQASNTSFDSTTVTVTFSSATAGNLLIGSYGLRGTFGGTVTASAGWTEIVSVANNGGVSSPDHHVFYKVAAGGETSVTFTDSLASGCNMIGVVDEWSGITASPYDVSATSDSALTNSVSASSGTTATLAQASELCIAAWMCRGTQTTASFTNSFTQDALVSASGNASFPTSMIVAYREVSSTSAVETTCTWDTSVRSVGSVSTFKLTSPPAPLLTRRPRLAQPMFRGSY